ncbi:uncharacterized protein LOC123533302 isoform X1 [Mercenaria mercenaria]|uniref:uncharacterized protein LOC123533302 isoform X1 n=2 Tax=Mercenaria mercenaria TaxID=6596 RepID=UPI00234FA742|nr:uncharacterized protein LOC123533302 isoform X1 [Mercenaria mercenaria]
MCLPCMSLFSCFIEFLPYICLVTIPFFGSFEGIDVILRLSLLIFLYTTVSEIIPRSLHYAIPYLNMFVLAMIVIYLPLGAIPYPVIWLYDKILWLSDPLLLAVEVVLALNFVMHCSRRCAENIEEDEDEAWKWKVLLSVFSAACYAILAVLVLHVYQQGSDIQFWIVVLILCFSFMLAAHNMMWMSVEGIISDVAFVTLTSMVILYTMKEEVSLKHKPLATPPTWYSFYTRGSLLTETYKIIHTSLENAQIALLYLKRFLSPLFLLLLGVRLYSILFLIGRIMKNFELETEESYLQELQTELSPLRSPFIVKCSMIFMITQFTTRLYYQCNGLSVLPKWLDSLLPADLLMGRMFQVVVLNSFYIWRLYCADNWQWSDWFSA